MSQWEEEVRKALQNSSRLAGEANTFVKTNRGKPPTEWSTKRDKLVARIEKEIARLKRLTPARRTTDVHEDLVNRAFALGQFKEALGMLGKK